MFRCHALPAVLGLALSLGAVFGPGVSPAAASKISCPSGPCSVVQRAGATQLSAQLGKPLREGTRVSVKCKEKGGMVRSKGGSKSPMWLLLRDHNRGFIPALFADVDTTKVRRCKPVLPPDPPPA
ncbi:MAG TPA: hypothetical protein VMR98_03430 [Candidatus Polarisedimenticolaceae bacterium]|nr:hypothetical protein [Candidatus Polarisedimenticolaceae bacterium]